MPLVDFSRELNAMLSFVWFCSAAGNGMAAAGGGELNICQTVEGHDLEEKKSSWTLKITR